MQQDEPQEPVRRGDLGVAVLRFQLLVLDGQPLDELCGGVPWTEIDTPKDLQRAEQTVWPRLHDTPEDAA